MKKILERPSAELVGRCVLLAQLLLIPALARAELMDKEFSFATVGGWASIGSALAYFAARFRPWLLLPVLITVGGFFFLQVSELLDPFVGPALAAEAGQMYEILSWSAPVLVLVCAVAGYLQRVRVASSLR